MCAPNFCARCSLSGPPHCAQAHFSCKLHAKVAKPAHSLNGNGVAGTRSVTERVEGRYPGTHKRGSIFRLESVRYQGKRACLRNHRFRVATVSCDAGHNGICTVSRFTTAAGLAGSVLTSEKSNSDTLVDLPRCHARTHFLYSSDNLVARHARIRKVGELRFQRCFIRMAYAASLDADTHLSGAGDGNLSFDQGENAR